MFSAPLEETTRRLPGNSEWSSNIRMGRFERMLLPIFESTGEAPRAKLFHPPMFEGAKGVQLGFGTFSWVCEENKICEWGGWKSRGVVNSRINGLSLVIMAWVTACFSTPVCEIFIYPISTMFLSKRLISWSISMNFSENNSSWLIVPKNRGFTRWVGRAWQFESNMLLSLIFFRKFRSNQYSHFQNEQPPIRQQ